jgi:hypothetical protein
MMRPMPVIGKWATNVSYPVGRVVSHNNINYRARKAHTSSAPPNTDFVRWERVNNNDGSWQPQIIYAEGDRVTYQGSSSERFRCTGAAGGSPPGNPALWEALPMTACGQLVQSCADDTGNRSPPRA